MQKVRVNANVTGWLPHYSSRHIDCNTTLISVKIVAPREHYTKLGTTHIITFPAYSYSYNLFKILQQVLQVLIQKRNN